MATINNSPKCCVYCGKTGKLTKDHIPPRCLFGKPASKKLLTVPACHSCHAPMNLDDEYFRLALTMREDIFDHPVVQKLLPAVFRSLEKPKKQRFARWFAAQGAIFDVQTPSGIYVGKKAGFHIDLPRLEAVTRRITMGLYFHETGSRLPDDYRAVSMLGNNIWMRPSEFKTIPALGAVVRRTPHTFGEDVFNYRFAIAADNPCGSIWLLTFYGRVVFVTITERTSELRPEDQ